MSAGNNKYFFGVRKMLWGTQHQVFKFSPIKEHDEVVEVINAKVGVQIDIDFLG